MGKIKSKLIKRTAEELIKRGMEFTDNFEENKRLLGNAMPSRKIRNQVAGYLTHINKKK